MLEIVQDEEDAPFAHVIEQVILQRALAVGGDAQRARHRRWKERRRFDGDQRCKDHAVEEDVSLPLGGLNREATLSNPTDSRDGEQPAIRIDQAPVNLGKLLLPPHETPRLKRQTDRRPDATGFDPLVERHRLWLGRHA